MGCQLCIAHLNLLAIKRRRRNVEQGRRKGDPFAVASCGIDRTPATGKGVGQKLHRDSYQVIRHTLGPYSAVKGLVNGRINGQHSAGGNIVNLQRVEQAGRKPTVF